VWTSADSVLLKGATAFRIAEFREQAATAGMPVLRDHRSASRWLPVSYRRRDASPNSSFTRLNRNCAPKSAQDVTVHHHRMNKLVRSVKADGFQVTSSCRIGTWRGIPEFPEILLMDVCETTSAGTKQSANNSCCFASTSFPRSVAKSGNDIVDDDQKR
jgi:hypothetical protein